MSKLVTVAQMRAVEKEADARGVTYDMMMENAGRRVAELASRVSGWGAGRSVVGLIGPGNNGGDTLIALRALALEGWNSTAYMVNRDRDTLVRKFGEIGGSVIAAGQDTGFRALETALRQADVLLDGVLGTGIRLPVREDVREVLKHASTLLNIRTERPIVVAVDCPSGVDCDTGEVAAETIRADLTITIACVKEGLLKLPAHDYVGELLVADIGLPADLRAMKELGVQVADRDHVRAMLPPRSSDAHKGSFGTAVVAAGSVNYTGAALLAGRAAYRVGAGLVTLAVPAPLHTALAAAIPEATWLLLPHEMGVIGRDAEEVLRGGLARATALLVGPGLGTEATTADFVQGICTLPKATRKSGGPIGFVSDRAAPPAEIERAALPPLVIDADGLRLLSRLTDWHHLIPGPSVLTPHPGEMAVMAGLTVDEIQANRREVAASLARQWGHVVVLKGAFTVVAAPGGALTIIPVATSGLAKGGTGDVLAGAIVGLRAQGLDAYSAAVAGAWLHGRAGVLAARRGGSAAAVLAGEVADTLREALFELSQPH